MTLTIMNKKISVLLVATIAVLVAPAPVLGGIPGTQGKEGVAGHPGNETDTGSAAGASAAGGSAAGGSAAGGQGGNADDDAP